jgi:hypothetical protein
VQPPFPSQVELASHGAGVQVNGAPAHLPAPSQASPLVQGLPSSHVAPVRMVQVPSWLAPSALLQARHPADALLQAVSQQNPFTQKPLVHEAATEQGEPWANCSSWNT